MNAEHRAELERQADALVAVIGRVGETTSTAWDVGGNAIRAGVALTDLDEGIVGAHIEDVLANTNGPITTAYVQGLVVGYLLRRELEADGGA